MYVCMYVYIYIYRHISWVVTRALPPPPSGRHLLRPNKRLALYIYIYIYYKTYKRNRYHNKTDHAQNNIA